MAAGYAVLFKRGRRGISPLLAGGRTLAAAGLAAVGRSRQPGEFALPNPFALVENNGGSIYENAAAMPFKAAGQGSAQQAAIRRV